MIINVALTGMVPTKEDNPNLPVTPDEIAQDALRCYNAGATIFHIHARDEQGKPTWKFEVYKEIVTKIRTLIPGAIICGSTSGRLWSDFDLRSEVLRTPIDMASLTMGSLNFPTGASANPPNIINRLLEEMNRSNIKPEIEIFDVGMLDYTLYLIEKFYTWYKNGKPNSLYMNLFLGNLGTLSATPQNLAFLLSKLPLNTIWAATGVGKYQFEVNKWAVALGGNVRVGLEDSIWMDKDKTDLASNVRQVERIVNVARAMGREPSTLAETKWALLGV